MNAHSKITLHTGRSMPVLGLGTWELTDDTANAVVQALQIGYRMIDTSGDYGTQPAIAEALRRSPIDRDALYVVTKVEQDEDSYRSAQKQVAELGLRRADLILIHRPPDHGVGVDLWQGLIRARSDGITRDIGVSNYSIEQLDRLVKETGETPVVNQIEWTPFGWSPEMLEYCREHRIVIQAYSPLTRGERLDDRRLMELARQHGATPAQLMLRWNLERGVVPLPKANQRQHQIENLGVFDVRIEERRLTEIDQLNEEWSSLGSSLQYL